jgi:hypothetical protein
MVRRLAAMVAALGLLFALAAPVLATDLNPDHVGAVGSTFQQGENCDALDLEPGSVQWHFILTNPDADSGHLTATFEDAGEITVANGEPFEADVLHFYITTPTDDTLLSAETTDVDGDNLNLSHTCFEPGEEIPEVPFAALLPAALIAAFGGYLFLQRRKSSAV